MGNKPITWGIIIFVVSLLGWVTSIVFNVLTLGAFRWVSNMFAIIALFSLPVALCWKLVKRSARK